MGTGPVGCELGQAFQRLGIEVTMLERENNFLPWEDSDATAVLHEQMLKDGVKINFNTKVTKFELLEGTSHWNTSTWILVQMDTPSGIIS